MNGLDDQQTMMPAVEPLGQPQGPMQPTQPAKQDDEGDPAVRASVKRWLERVEKAEKHWEEDFKRMRQCMDFVAGYQWNAQTKLDDERYIANMTIRMINQKVATLYARNPQVEAQRRKRLDFRIWDGKVETLQQAQLAVVMGMQAGVMPPPEAIALVQDFQQGTMMQQLTERVGRTLEILYQYECDTQEPNFKTQVKQFVRRACVCGVAYIKVAFVREGQNHLVHSETKMSIMDRLQRVQEIANRMKDGRVDEANPDLQTLRSLVMSLGMAPLDSEAAEVKERLVYDFPQATAIIPDEDCRCLKGFVGAHWIAERFDLPLMYVNAFFGKDIKPGTDLKTYTSEGQPIIETGAAKENTQDLLRQRVKVYAIYDLDTKTVYTVCQGYKDYLEDPLPATPAVKGFWTIFPLTFNDTEREPGCKSTIFPPSDVQLIRPIQKEWNRTRQALRNQRKANAPKYMAPKGVLTENDKRNIQAAEDNQIVELEGLPPGTEPSKILQPFQHAEIDPGVYDTKPLSEDSLLATGQQEANVGPAQPNVTATVGSIAEQSRMTVAGSNVDDLDDCLSDVARAGGEMLLREMSPQTVMEIVGVGAVWPQENRERYINEIELRVVAASSGRPNKALEANNWNLLAPLLRDFGANPQPVIRETVKRLDDRLEPAEFFPLPMPMLPVQGEQVQQGNPPEGGATQSQTPQPPPTMTGGAPLSLGGS